MNQVTGGLDWWLEIGPLALAEGIPHPLFSKAPLRLPQATWKEAE